MTDPDRVVAKRIADEVRALTGRRRTWRKVTSLLHDFSVYRLTSNARARISAALNEAGLDVEPSLLEVERYGTVRLALIDHSPLLPPETSKVARLQVAAKALDVLLWREGEAPQPIGLEEVEGLDGGVLWLNVDGATADAKTLHAALTVLCGDDVTPEIVEDLLAADEFPQVKHYGPLRLVSSFSVSAEESEAEAGASESKAGSLSFQPVEFVIAQRWLITCWQVTPRPEELVEAVGSRWAEEDFRTPGDLALLILRELADTYTHARRQLYSWLESWELDFFNRHDATEIETLSHLRHLIADFRKQLAELHRSGIRTNQDLVWFPHVTNLAEAEKVDEIIDRAFRDLRALGEGLLASINLVSTMTAARQSRQTERFQRVVTAAAAILLVPGLVATVYGANTPLPLGDRWIGFLLLLALMAITGALTYAVMRTWQTRQLTVDDSNVVRPHPVAGEVVSHPEPPPPADVDGSAAVTLHDYLASDPHSRSPKLLRILAESGSLTPEQIGEKLAPTNNGVPLTKQQARAVLRNLARTQGHLIRATTISREVIVKDFTRYDLEGAGRYGLSETDQRALQRHLGERRP